MATLKIEGQEYQIDDAIANGGATIQESDQLLRDALRPNFEIAAGAVFQRETRNNQPYITLVKQPGPKGAHASAATAVGCFSIDQSGNGTGLRDAYAGGTEGARLISATRDPATYR